MEGKINNLEIVVCDESNSLKYIYGSSLSGNTRVTKVIVADVTNSDELFEYALENSSEDKITIVLYNHLESNLTPCQIMTFIEEVLKDENLDIFYLYKYCDTIKFNTSLRSIGQLVLTNVISPHGIEGLLIKPRCKKILKKVLKQDNGRGYDFALNAYCEKLNAYSSEPSIFRYNLNIDTKEKDVLTSIKLRKISNREPKEKAKLHTRNQGIFNLVWFIFSVVALFVFSFFLFEDIEDVDKQSFGLYPYKSPKNNFLI